MAGTADAPLLWLLATVGLRGTQAAIAQVDARSRCRRRIFRSLHWALSESV
jgi:hypothetical protein